MKQFFTIKKIKNKVYVILFYYITPYNSSSGKYKSIYAIYLGCPKSGSVLQEEGGVVSPIVVHLLTLQVCHPPPPAAI